MCYFFPVKSTLILLHNDQASGYMQSDLLDIYPLQLHFPFKRETFVVLCRWAPKRAVCCPLRLTNRTDDYVILRWRPCTSERYFEELGHLNGVLSPRSTCTYVVVMKKPQHKPTNMNAFSVILESCAAEKIMDANECIANQDHMHAVTTKNVSDEEVRSLVFSLFLGEQRTNQVPLETP